jgi:hypothetical protein
MKIIGLSLPLGIATPFGPTCEPPQAKHFKRIGIDCDSADHPTNTNIRQWMPRQAKEADARFRKKQGTNFEERLVDGKSAIGRCVAFVDDDEYDTPTKQNEAIKRTHVGDAIHPVHVVQIDALSGR